MSPVAPSWTTQPVPLQAGLPDPIYVGPVVIGLLGSLGILYLIDPPVTDWTVPGLAPWFAVGGVAHALYIQSVFPEVVAPLFDTPMVYLTTALVTAVVWILSELVAEMRPPSASTDRQTGVLGAVALIVAVGVSIGTAFQIGSQTGVGLQTFWPLIAFFGTATATGLFWVIFSLGLTNTAAATGTTGVTVMFAHALDGVGVLVAVDLLSELGGQRPVLANVFVELGKQVPLLGGGAVFVAAKFVLVILVLVVFKRYVNHHTGPARLTLGVVAAAGLAPGIHTFVLLIVQNTL